MWGPEYWGMGREQLSGFVLTKVSESGELSLNFGDGRAGQAAAVMG